MSILFAMPFGKPVWRAALVLLLSGAAANPAVDVKLPMAEKSVRFAVIGDSGSGDKPQYDVGRVMAEYRENVQFDFVVMLGDNIYGGKSPADFKRKFEDPYAQLLSAGVKFFAALGNHDGTSERYYKPFNMDGRRYYNYKRGDAEFFALDSNYMDPEQLKWLRDQLTKSGAKWKICYFHHPLYSDGKKHGPDLDLRRRLEPMFIELGVNVVLTGHEHFYERIKPKNGIAYFVLGNSGELRFGNLRRTPDVEKGFDSDRSFGMMEVAGDELHFQIVSRAGATVDSGVLNLPGKK
ncbi:MAG: metallophosphoesterase [Candidatus Solibacter sp.]